MLFQKEIESAHSLSACLIEFHLDKNREGKQRIHSNHEKQVYI
jgi:hypothetical protein